MTPSLRLTLGALYREMRAGLGDAGWVRATLEFRQRTVAAALAGVTPDAPGGGSLVLRALIDQRDGVLDRCEIALDGGSASRRLLVRRSGGGYAYSIDGGRRWGPFAAPPRIFEVAELEAALELVAVEDVTVEPVPAVAGAEEEAWSAGSSPAPDAAAAHALDVSLDREAFVRLMGIFAADPEDGPDAPALTAYSVSLEASSGVSLLYWWSLGGLDRAPADPAARGLRVSCGVSLRLAAGREPAPDRVVMAPGLPEVRHLDDVWELIRRGVSGDG